ncbi:MAG: lysozyme inhibitor LprI family protein [Xanthobacteraceae bacterium]
MHKAVSVLGFAVLLAVLIGGSREASAQCTGWPVSCTGVPRSGNTSEDDDGAPCRGGWFHGPVWNALLGTCPPAGSQPGNAEAGRASQRPVTYNPSFRCELATIEVEVTICVNANLAALDRRMSRVYRQAQATLDESDRQAFALKQGRWRRDHRDPCGSNVDCISTAYVERLQTLHALAASPPVTYNPSFSCELATTTTERAICADSELAALDRQMSEVYEQLQATLDESDRQAFAVKQGRWRRDNRDTCGNNIACIASAYLERLRTLSPAEAARAVRNAQLRGAPTVDAIRHLMRDIENRKLTGEHLSECEQTCSDDFGQCEPTSLSDEFSDIFTITVCGRIMISCMKKCK